MEENEIQIYEDERGVIQTLLKSADIIRITSKKGSRRANHYHKTSSHWCLVTKGSITYFERPVDSGEKPDVVVYKQGDLFYTGPMLEHLMLFETHEDNEFYCFSQGSREQDAYEDDLVRLAYDLDKI